MQIQTAMNMQQQTAPGAGLNYFMPPFIFLLIIILIINGSIWSYVVEKLANIKGWYGFRIYGFFFGIIALIYVAGLPEKK